MTTKLYYTVEKEIDSTGESLTGNKIVSVYGITNNEPKKFFELDLTNNQNSKKEIKRYLDDNGYSDEIVDLILL